MSNRPTISATIITRNEREALPGLLDSLAWLDEVVVVDGGSTDDTVNYARRRGCRVATREFDDFASQRNYAMRIARGNWVLAIDADERVTPGLAGEIRRRLGSERFDAYRTPIRSRIFGRRLRFSGTQDDQPIRLARRDSSCWRGAVHEVLRPASGHVGQLRGTLEHETLGDLSEFLEKMNRYTTLEVARRLERGTPPRRGDVWLSPVVEIGRRMIYKLGMFDGPQGWAFCLLSGLSAWVTANRHRQRWRERMRQTADAIPSAGQSVRFTTKLTPARLLANEVVAP